MDSERFTPEESLLLIRRTIEEAQERFKKNGQILIFWGSLILIVSVSQYILIRFGLANMIGLPPLLYPLVGVPYLLLYTWRERRKNSGPKTIIGKIIGAMGWIVGLNLLCMGFLFSDKMGEHLLPVFLIFLAMLIILTGISIRFTPLVIGGSVLNVLGFVAFYCDWQYHPLFMSIGSVIAVLIPGILLNKDRRRDNV